MDTEIYNNEHAHSKEIIDKKLPAKWIDMLENGIDFDRWCNKFSVYQIFYFL